MADANTNPSTESAAPAATPATPAAAPASLSIEASAAPAVPASLITEAEINTVAAEFETTGSVSEKTLEGFKAKGIDPGLVSRFVQGQAALREQAAQKITNSVGGVENFNKAKEWALANLPKSEQDAFNAVVRSGNVEQAALAAQGLYAKYTAAVGSDPVLAGGRAGASGPAPFRSKAEIVNVFGDKRYGVDEAFTADARARMEASMRAGVV